MGFLKLFVNYDFCSVTIVINSVQHKNANIASFVLALSLEINNNANIAKFESL